MAGFGTRRLPITKAIEKCMLPVGNRPIVEYVVDDCLRAGITDIIFVVSEQFNQLQTYYGENKILEEYLIGKGKTSQLEQVKELASKANFHYVVQDQHQPYGTAVPVALCADMVQPGEQVLILMGDDFIYNKDGESEAKRLMQAVQDSGATAGLLATRVPKEDVSKYGVIEMSSQDGREFFKRIVEQPNVEDAPSDLINISKYVFDHDMMQAVAQVMENPPAANGEYQIIEALNIYNAQNKPITVVPVTGQYLDCGSVEGWLHANNVVLGS
jgi:UTP--glucose-1-phosphate uridylyltransferase